MKKKNTLSLKLIKKPLAIALKPSFVLNRELEIAMISAIMSDHITKKLYKKIQEGGNGYMATVETIAIWAVEFYNKHKETDWEEVLNTDNEMKPLSKQIKSIIWWDDAVFDYAHYKFSLM